MFQVVYGIGILLHGYTFGAFHLLRGLSQEAVPGVLKSAKFQDWAIREAGIAPGSIAARQYRNWLNKAAETKPVVPAAAAQTISSRKQKQQRSSSTIQQILNEVVVGSAP
jgi:hypothetical protein